VEFVNKQHKEEQVMNRIFALMLIVFVSAQAYATTNDYNIVTSGSAMTIWNSLCVGMTNKGTAITVYNQNQFAINVNDIKPAGITFRTRTTNAFVSSQGVDMGKIFTKEQILESQQLKDLAFAGYITVSNIGTAPVSIFGAAISSTGTISALASATLGNDTFVTNLSLSAGNFVIVNWLGETKSITAANYSTDSTNDAYVYVRSGSNWSTMQPAVQPGGYADLSPLAINSMAVSSVYNGTSVQILSVIRN